MTDEKHRPGDNVETGALKKDQGKLAVWNGVLGRFPEALRQVAAVSEYGKNKYGTWEGWRGVPDRLTRYRNALARHLLAWAEHQYDDTDSGLPHLAQVAWNALALLEILVEDGDITALGSPGLPPPDPLADHYALPGRPPTYQGREPVVHVGNYAGYFDHAENTYVVFDIVQAEKVHQTESRDVLEHVVEGLAAADNRPAIKVQS